MPNVILTPEEQHFVDARVASGEFASADEVMREALRAMREASAARERFTAMLDAVSERADREGTYSIEEVEAELTAIIEAAQHRA